MLTLDKILLQLSVTISLHQNRQCIICQFIFSNMLELSVMEHKSDI